MKNVKQSFTTVLMIAVLIMMSLSLAACSKDSNPAAPVITNISGKWDGQITHPGYTGGSIKLTVLQTDNAVSGTFLMRLVRDNFVQGFEGEVAGSKIDDQNYALTLTGSNFTWICSLNLNSTTLDGTWESTVTSIGGTITVNKD